MAFPMLLNKMCLRPCVGAVNIVFLGVKDWWLKRGVPLTLIFFIFDRCLLKESKSMEAPFNEDVRAKGISSISLMRIKIVSAIRCCNYRS
jgi:hypothetical protein